MASNRDGRNSGEPEKEGGLSVRSVRDLLSVALADLPGFPLVLRFRASDDEMEDWSHISQSLPWLHAVGQDGFGTVCENLREHGLAGAAVALDLGGQQLGQPAHRLFLRTYFNDLTIRGAH